MLIITGTLAYDYIMDFPGKFSDHILAGSEHKINLSFIVNQFAKRRGGTAGNLSYGLGLLGAPHCLFSAAGRDFSEYKKKFGELGISVKHIKIDKKNYTATGFALTDNKDNQIWGYFYGAAEKMKSMKLNKLAKHGDMVLIGPSGATATVSFIKQCIDLGIEYMFDPGFILTQINNHDLLMGVKHASYIIGNDYEINLIQKRIKNLKSIIKKKTLITTFGEKGALIENGAKKIHIRPVTVKKAQDPTGAGDAWRAGFLAGLIKKFDLQTCGQLGSLISSYAVSCYGTQEYKFKIKEFTRRYKDEYNTEIAL